MLTRSGETPVLNANTDCKTRPTWGLRCVVLNFQGPETVPFERTSPGFPEKRSAEVVSGFLRHMGLVISGGPVARGTAFMVGNLTRSPKTERDGPDIATMDCGKFLPGRADAPGVRVQRRRRRCG